MNRKFGQVSTARMCMFLAAFVVAPAISFAQPQASVYGTLALVGDGSIEQSLDNFPASNDSLLNRNEIGIGYRLTYWTQSNFGAGLEHNYYGTTGTFNGPTVDVLDISTTSVLGLYRLPTDSAIQPYFGAGFGMRSIEQIANNGDGSSYTANYEPTFAASGIAGVSYNFNSNVSLFSELRMDYSGAASTTNDSDVEGEFPSLFTPSVNLGVSLSF